MCRWRFVTITYYIVERQLLLRSYLLNNQFLSAIGTMNVDHANIMHIALKVAIYYKHTMNTYLR